MDIDLKRNTSLKNRGHKRGDFCLPSLAPGWHMVLTINDIKIPINHLATLFVTCFVCINAGYFATAAACQHFSFKQRNVLLFKVCWYSLVLLKKFSYNKQNVGKECHKIVSVYTLETLNTVTTWNDITHSMFWKNAMLYTAGCNSVVILPIPRISFWLTHLPLEQLKILDNHLSSFHCRECDSVLATEIWERSLNRPLRKNLSPHRTSTGGNLPLPSNVINPCPSRERGNHLVTVK